MPVMTPVPAPAPEAVVTETSPQPLQDFAAGFFIVAVGVLSVISILGIWKIFGQSVIGKSFSTIGLLAVISIIVIIAGRYMDKEKGSLTSSAAPVFRSIRHITLGTLIVSAAGLALLGVLAIWEVMGGDVLYRSLSSLGVIAFCSLIAVMVCLERENNRAARDGAVPLVIILFVIGWVFMSLMRW